MERNFTQNITRGFGFLTLILASLLAGYSPVQAQEKGSVIVIGESADADQLNPYTNLSATGSWVNEYLYYGLLRADKGTQQFTPLIAAALPKVSDDGLTYTYTLDPAAKWNSGKPITHADVVFSMRMIKNHFLNNQAKRVHYENIISVTADEAGTVSFRLSRPSPSGLRITGDFAIMSEEYFDPDKKMMGIEWADFLNPRALPTPKLQVMKEIADKVNAFGSSVQAWNMKACAAPYLLTEWRRGDEIVLTYNKSFWGRSAPKNAFFKQNFETIRIRIVSDESRLRTMIFNKEIDCSPSLSAALFKELREIPLLQNEYRFETPPGYSYDYIGVNMQGSAVKRTAIFENELVRKAIAHLIKVEYLLESVRYGLGERITTGYPFNQLAFVNRDLDMISYDEEKAKVLLMAAGWVDTNGDGILDGEVNGQRINFEFEVMYNDNKPERKIIAEHLKEMCGRIGIKVNIMAYPWKDYLERLKARNFDMVVGAWVSDPNEDSYRQNWHTSSIGNGGSNWMGFGDAVTDRLIEAYDTELDPAKRKSIAMQIQTAIYNAQPCIFLWMPTQSIVVRKKYKNAPVFSVRPGFWVADWE